MAILTELPLVPGTVTAENVRRETRIPELDGLRGVAILLVFAYHTCSSNAPPFKACCSASAMAMPLRVLMRIADQGSSGVDLFFVLSGFLITGILLDARGSSNYFRVFYFRRALRIFPVYYLSLIFLFRLVHPSWREQVWYWLNLSNLRSAFAPQRIPALSHFWSLAVEEQFYLVWPWVVSRFRERRLFLVSLAGIVAATILRNLPAVQQVNVVYDNFIYRFTPFRVDSLLFGALIAIAIKKGLSRDGSIKWILGSWICGSALAGLATRSAAGVSRYGFTGTALIASGLVLLCALWSGHRAVQVFRLRPLRELGRYSYCIYVIHLFVIAVLGDFLRSHFSVTAHPYPSLLAAAAVELCICYGFARLSWALIEGPALSLKRLMKYQPRHATRSLQAV
jgi:peptidoglycan/LPS O-acetylase OafA/YrhL